MSAEFLAFDPGKTTGFVHARVRHYKDFDLLEVGDITWEVCLPTLCRLIQSSHPQVTIIVEDFRLYAHAAKDLINNSFPAVKVIGRLEALQYIYRPDADLLLQMPAERMSVKILLEHEDTLRGTHHARDAYRHLRYYLVKNRIDYSSS